MPTAAKIVFYHMYSRNGSVIVIFTIFIQTTTNAPLLERDDLIIIVGLVIPDDATYKYLDYLQIGIPTVQLLDTNVVEPEEVPQSKHIVLLCLSIVTY